MWSQNNTLTQTQLTAKIGAVLFCQYLTAPKHLHWALVWESMWWLNSGGVSLYLLNLYFSAKPNRSQAGSELSSIDTPVSALSNFYTQQDFTNWQNCRKCKGPCKYMEWKLQILENCVTNSAGTLLWIYQRLIGRSYIALARQDQYIGNISDPLGRLRSWLFSYLLQCCICICNTSIVL